MQGMDMGLNRFNLKRVKVSGYEQQWLTDSIIPICTTRRKDWLITLGIKINNIILSEYYMITIS